MARIIEPTVRWLGTILCLIGIFLTSRDMFPINLYFGAIGSFLWAMIGIHRGDGALFLVEIIAVWFYISGFYT